MAESIEATDDGMEGDADRQIDRTDFRKAQFDIFKHAFLESFDEAGYEKLENLTLSPALKKDVVNMVRRLQKAKLSLECLKAEDRAAIGPVTAKMEDIFRQLIQISKQTSEFSARNMQLPGYDRKDVESLFGKQADEEKPNPDEGDTEQQQKSSAAEHADDGDDPIKWLCRSNEEFERKIMELLGAGELLMNEWHEIRHFVKGT